MAMAAKMPIRTIITINSVRENPGVAFFKLVLV
jgi:hypothetical protein